MNPFAGSHLKNEEGKEDEAEEQKHVLEAAIYRLVGICHLDERDAQGSCIQTANGVDWSFRPRAPRNKGHGPLRSETVTRHGPADWQESAVEPWVWPAPLRGQMSGLAIRQHCDSLGA